MKLLWTAGAATLSLVLAVAPLTYGQDQKPPEEAKPEAKPAEHAPKAPTAKPKPEHSQSNSAASQQTEKQPQQNEKQQKQAEKQTKQEQKTAQNTQKKQAQEEQKQQAKLQKQQDQEEKQEREHSAPAANAPAQPTHAADVRGGGRRIPDNEFRAHFGREHHFHISRPVVVEGAPRFQYAGFWFALMDPWPAAWSYDDDLYIDYIDGMYYLCDPVHPGVEISITVVG